MPAEPPRTTVHQVQHLIFDGCRILRTRTANSLEPETLAALDRMIAEASPIDGFNIVPVEVRHYGLAHGLRALVEDVVPYLDPGPVDASEFIETMRKVEAELKALRDNKIGA